MKTRVLLILMVLTLMCLTCEASSSEARSRDYGAAAELRGDYWFHVTKPLTLETLRSKVILIDMWKFT
ncbi:MAG: hypothetical protein JW704_06920 [Anaerolineaceae bacterium]|nr:hypothetical protein [Anaerolineaceae bacterium]MBN2676548.1 hypothetical protein [Anaerolineaceae bacterium]